MSIEMDLVDIINSRRSIRKYHDKNVSEDLVTKLLMAAMSAPSAGNQQPWEFIIIRNRNILDKIPEIHKAAKMIKEASVGILVCGNLEREKYKDFWIQDCSAATENILLAAHALGLASVWCGCYPRKERMEGLRELLHLPKHIVPFSLLPIGYGAEEKPPANRYDKTRIHIDEW